MEPPEDRPESLPEQVRRLATGAWRRAYRARGEWALWACVAAYVILAAATKGIDAIPPPTSRAMWYLSLVWSLVYPAVTTSFLFAGLWAALSKGSLGSRVARSLALVLIVVALTGRWNRLDSGLFYLLGAGYQWTLWFGAGLTLRAIRYGVFCREEEAAPPTRVGIVDLLTLTGAVAVSLGLSDWSSATLKQEMGFEFVKGDTVFNAVSYVGFAILYAFTLAPLLWAAFPVGAVSVRRLAGCALLTYTLMTAAYVVRFLVANRSQGAPLDGGSILRLVAGYALYPLGTILGVIAVALFTRWAGYRLRRPANRPVAPAAAGR